METPTEAVSIGFPREAALWHASCALHIDLASRGLRNDLCGEALMQISEGAEAVLLLA